MMLGLSKSSYINRTQYHFEVLFPCCDFLLINTFILFDLWTVMAKIYLSTSGFLPLGNKLESKVS